MKYSILKHIRCPHTRHANFQGEYDFTTFQQLAIEMVTYGEFDQPIEKQDLPMFSCTTFDYNIRADCAKPTNLFALDFDDIDNNIETAFQYFKDYGYLIYTSYSHTEQHHKFRVIVKLDIDIRSNEESHIVFNILNTRLKAHGLTLDTQCRDISRRFFLPSINKQGQLPVIEFNEGMDISVEQDFIKALEEKIREDQIREQRMALKAFNQLCNPRPLPSIEDKIDNLKTTFLSDPSHSNLRALIAGMMFWEIEKDVIVNWIVDNYHPTSGHARNEANNWYNWLKRKGNPTYSQKYS